MDGAIAADRDHVARALTHRLRGELLTVAGTLGARDVHRPPLRAECARDHGLRAPRGPTARRRIEYHMGMKHQRQTRYNLVCRSRISGVLRVFTPTNSALPS